jgi:hypothetical protein|tara:strand:+ start:72 stop:308 length:237 start_codon:yes stop_codon:yes gene_type:complete
MKDILEEIIDILDCENSGQSAEQRLVEIKECTNRVNMEEAVKFYNWMRENDTQDNAEKYCGFSDEDMYHEYKSNTEGI